MLWIHFQLTVYSMSSINLYLIVDILFFRTTETPLILQIFEEENVHQMLTIGELPLYMIPLDEDILSFELDMAYRV